MFLPIAPEIEDPEPDMLPPPIATSTSSKCRTIDIHLDNATDGKFFFFYIFQTFLKSCRFLN